ncbi:MAG: DNA-3-methyladenine glycosylase family protein [Candidatus Njordarchaeia archaeon]
MAKGLKEIKIKLVNPFSLQNTLLGYVFPYFNNVNSMLHRCDVFWGEVICYGFYQRNDELVVKPCSSVSETTLYKLFNMLFDIETNYDNLIREKIELDGVVEKAVNEVTGYKIFSSTNLFEILASAIISQNVSFNTFRKLLHVFVESLSKYQCFTYLFPSPDKIIEKRSTLERLGLGYKAKTLLNISQFALENGLPVNGTTREIIEELTAVKGIGIYTATMYTFFGLRRLDSPIYDRFIVKNVMNDLLNLNIKTFREFDSTTERLWGELRGLILAILIAFVYLKKREKKPL